MLLRVSHLKIHPVEASHLAYHEPGADYLSHQLHLLGRGRLIQLQPELQSRKSSQLKNSLTARS